MSRHTDLFSTIRLIRLKGCGLFFPAVQSVSFFAQNLSYIFGREWGGIKVCILSEKPLIWNFVKKNVNFSIFWHKIELHVFLAQYSLIGWVLRPPYLQVYIVRVVLTQNQTDWTAGKKRPRQKRRSGHSYIWYEFILHRSGFIQYRYDFIHI